MKRTILMVFLSLAARLAAHGAPAQLYQNFGLTNNAQVDAINFYNQGIFDVNTLSTVTNLSAAINFSFDIPYDTMDTLNYTNRGTMNGLPGFRFDTVTPTTRHSASNFVNLAPGAIVAQDSPGGLLEISKPGGTAVVVVNTAALPTPALVQVYATNIYNTGTISVGNAGLLQMIGKNITNANGVLSAGAVSDEDPNSGTSRGIAFDPYFVAPLDAYDLFWGITNYPKLDVSGEIFTNFFGGGFTFFPNFPPLTFRGGSGAAIFLTANLASYVFTNQYDPTNFYYNIVLINTNLTDTNITTSVAFSPPFQLQVVLPQNPLNPGGMEAMVQFSEPVLDSITGQIVTNSVYLLDTGAALDTFKVNTNAAYANGYGRPDGFEISTSTIFTPEWTFGSPSNAVLDPTVISPGNTYATTKVPVSSSGYGVQIGRNPEDVNGNFSATLGSLVTNALVLSTSGFSLDFPDPTNEPGRVEIQANELNLIRSRIRAEGVVTLNATNLIGGSSMSSKDWPNINCNLGSTNGYMLVSNIFPTTFQRVRGDIYAFSQTWINTETNATATNINHIHILWVDSALQGTFQSSIRDLTLNAGTTVVQDSLRVVNSDLFKASNLTFNSSVALTQNAGNCGPANVPNLKNLFINTNGSLAVDQMLDLGFDVTKSQSSPIGRKYTINSVTNLGSIISSPSLLESLNFDNEGTITASNSGALVIDAAAISMVPTETNGPPNALIAEGGITLSALSIVYSNLNLIAGTNLPGSTNGTVLTSGGIILISTNVLPPLNDSGQLTLEAINELSDGVSGAATTNNVIVNNWEITDGLSLSVKPPEGDLFGTKIRTVAQDYTVAQHVWPGYDAGPVPAGFSNNLVIGHLVLDRTGTNAILQFSAAGAQNAMYVDYLELADLSYTDYRNGLVIDPNFTIYFAGANVDPLKLEEAYPGRFVWVQDFAGPNSSKLVSYLDGSTCLMNAALADSPDIDSDGDGIPNAYDPYPLNNSVDGAIIPCSDVVQSKKSFLVSSTNGYNSFTLSVIGDGAVTPSLKSQQMAYGKSYSLTATAATGWVFDGWSGTIASSLPQISFALRTNIVLTANFIRNPFIPMAGIFNGLFYDTNGVATNSSGFFTFKLNNDGTFSGKLIMGPNSYPFSSLFKANGSGQAVVKRAGLSSLTVNLQLDNNSGEVQGNVTDGVWNAQLLGDLAVASTAKNPSPLAGKYTMALPGGSDSAIPGGDSFGFVTVSPSGAIIASMTLADGSSISQSSTLSKFDKWPFYGYTGSGKDSLLGWVEFATNGFGGTITWNKGAVKGGKYYPAGFNAVSELIGSRYTAPAKGTGLNLIDPVILLSGGDLEENLTNSVTSSKLTYSVANVNLTINPAAGSFSGHFEYPGAKTMTLLQGVVLQNQNSARGFFLGTNESGAAILEESK